MGTRVTFLLIYWFGFVSVGQTAASISNILGRFILKSSMICQNKSAPRCRCGYLDSGLGEVDAAGQVLPDKGVGVVRPLEDALQSLQLAAVEGGPVPALLSLLLLLRVHLLICTKQKKKKEKKQRRVR